MRPVAWRETAEKAKKFRPDDLFAILIIMEQQRAGLISG